MIALGHDQLTEVHGDEWRNKQCDALLVFCCFQFWPSCLIASCFAFAPYGSAYATVFFSRLAYNRSVLLRDIEDRISRLTMIRQVRSSLTPPVTLLYAPKSGLAIRNWRPAFADCVRQVAPARNALHVHPTGAAEPIRTLIKPPLHRRGRRRRRRQIPGTRPGSLLPDQARRAQRRRRRAFVRGVDTAAESARCNARGREGGSPHRRGPGISAPRIPAFARMRCGSTVCVSQCRRRRRRTVALLSLVDAGGRRARSAALRA